MLPADVLLSVQTPYGSPVAWAEVALVSDGGDSHATNDDRCLVITSRDLDSGATGPLSDFMLCVLADGATGSRFASDGGPAGWRASQLAQGAFVERFFASTEIDVLDRLKDGLRAADQALVDSDEGTLSTTLTVLLLSADGTAHAASIGDSVLLVLPPTRRTPGDRRLKKLGYEDTTAVGSGDTTLSFVDENELIEQWWPNKEGGSTEMRVKPDTYFVLMSDGISDNLPTDVIDQLVHRHTLDRATVGLPRRTREQRALAQKRGGGSTSDLGLDNMSAITVRFKPAAALLGRPAGPSLSATRVLTVQAAGASGQFAVVALAGEQESQALVPAFLRNLVETDAANLSTLPDSLLPSAPGASSVAEPYSPPGAPSVVSSPPGAPPVVASPTTSPRSAPGSVPSSSSDSDSLQATVASALSIQPVRATPSSSESSESPPSQAIASAARARFAFVALDQSDHLHSASAGWLDLPSVLNVSLARRSVVAAHDTLLQQFIYSPRLWASSLAALALFALVSTAFATGTVRPAPPPVATTAPGLPTPTPDVRPMLAFGGFQLVPPKEQSVLAPPPTPSSPSDAAIVADDATPVPATQTDQPQPPAPACSNPLGLFCGSVPPPQPARPPAPAAQRTPVQARVIPGPSPAPRSAAETGPPPGSNLDRALQIASVANDQFNRSIDPPTP